MPIVPVLVALLTVGIFVATLRLGREAKTPTAHHSHA